MATISDEISVNVTTIGIGRVNSPIGPVRKNAIGRNAATTAPVDDSIGHPTSFVASSAAVIESLPIPMWRKMFSQTTIELSTIIPRASSSENSDTISRVIPLNSIAVNVIRIVIGSAKLTIAATRNPSVRNRISMTRSTPHNAWFRNSPIWLRTVSDESDITTTSLYFLSFVFMLSATSIVP